MESKQTFKIPEVNISDLNEKIAKLNRRAKKLDCPEITYNILSEKIEEVQRSQEYRDVEGFLQVRYYKELVKFFEVEISGTTPTVEGFQFIGTIQHMSEGNIIRTIPEVVVDHKYRTIEPFCQHCNTLRKRNDTFLVKDVEGVTKQIGRNCLQDFFPGKDVATLASRFELFLQIQAIGESLGSYGGGGKAYFSLLEFMTISASATRQYGFTPKSKADPEHGKFATSAITLETMFPNKDAKDKNPWKIEILQEDKETAEAAQAWAAALKEQNPDNDYLWNISLVANSEHITYRETGLAASIVSAFIRATKEKQDKADRKPSEYIGVIGKRQVFDDLKFDRVFSFEGHYGTTYFLTFYTESGSCVIWKTSTRGNWISGKTYKLKATVKNHKEYKGVKQTEISRAMEIE